MNLKLPEIETERLILRCVEEADASDMFDYFSDPEVLKYTTLARYNDINEMLESIQNYFLVYEKRGVPSLWVMEHKEDGRVIGQLEIHSMENGVGEISYLLHQDYWKQGYMKEALPQLITLGFIQLELYRIEIRMCTDNIASYKTALSCGCILEGKLRKLIQLNQTYHDVYVTSILLEEWRNLYDKTTRCKI